jgi:hypothetical protein
MFICVTADFSNAVYFTATRKLALQLFTRFLNLPLTSHLTRNVFPNVFPTVTAAAKAPFPNKELYYLASGEAIGFHPVHILVQLTSNYSPDSITKATSSRTAGSNQLASYTITCHILAFSFVVFVPFPSFRI